MNLQIPPAPLMGISQLICMYFILLDRPQNQLLCGIEYVYDHLRERYPSSIYCDHAKTDPIDCCLSLTEPILNPKIYDFKLLHVTQRVRYTPNAEYIFILSYRL